MTHHRRAIGGRSTAERVPHVTLHLRRHCELLWRKKRVQQGDAILWCGVSVGVPHTEKVAYVFQVHDTLHQWLHYGHGDPAPQVLGPLRHRPSESERLDRLVVADLRRSGGAGAHRRAWRWAVLARRGRLRHLHGICAGE